MSARSVAALGASALWFVTRVSAGSCFDGVRDGPESDVDCGGDCPPCERGDRCASARDCYSGRCAEGECEEQALEPGEAVPPGYVVETSTADGAALCRTLGWVSFGIGYAGAYAGALAIPGQVSWLYAPVLGPWVEVSQKGQSYRGLIAIDALLQTVGAALWIGGVAASGKQLVRTESVVAEVHVTPAVTASGDAGVFLHGLF